MKTEDLMIGDWVLTLESTHKEKVFAQVDAIEEGKHSILVTRECSNWFVDVDWIEPISLTSEILEKNGFRKSVSPPGIHAKCYEINNKDEKYCLTIANYNEYKRLLLDIDSEDSECFNIKCDYVHQLQHALRLCGIKKEIEL